jgi:hypothetical protein
MSSPRAEARRKRETRTTTMKSRSLLFQLPLPGAKASAASAHGPKEAAVAHAQCTPIAATMSPTAVRLSNSQGVSASGASSPSRMAHPPPPAKLEGS